MNVTFSYVLKHFLDTQVVSSQREISGKIEAIFDKVNDEP